MAMNESTLLAAMRGAIALDDVCRAAGVTREEFAAERDAWLRQRATLGDASLSGGVGGQVEILRDRAGVPHIYAEHTGDVFFGLGFAMAQDRLWQMDRLRRRALGRQAEILGPTYLASDIAHLTVGIDQIAEREVAATDSETARLVTSFAAGINRFIETGALPVEFAVLDYTPEPFTLRDIIAIARGIWWSLNGRIDRIAAAECARFFPTEQLRTRYLTPEASENLVAPFACGTDDTTGSNNWALEASRTASGKPILCGDPHQPFWVPSTWYEYALHGPQDDAAGAGHPGMPGLWWGSNAVTAWAITNNAASTRDLYREEVDPADASRYREGTGWRRFDERAVSIPVRGAPAHALTIRSTVRGPIVNALLTPVADEGDPPLSLRWVGMEHIDDLKACIAVSRAKDWNAFRSALRDWSIAVFNWAYADASGHVGYQMAGRLPIRGRITYGFRDAENPEDTWKGYIPFDELPRGFDPKRGYVASANQRIVPPSYPFPIYGAYSQGHRGVRIDQMFARESPFDLGQNIAFQNDVKNCRAERLCPGILAALARTADNPVKVVCGILSDWDYRYTLESSAPTVFEAFMTLWQREVLARHLPARLIELTVQQTGLAAELLANPALSYFPEGTRAVAQRVAHATFDTLQRHLGGDPAGWRWGTVHLAHWRHPISNPAIADAFDIGPAPVDGGSHTVRNTGGELPPHAATSGAEYRIVMDFAQPNEFLAVQNIGNSGVPGSPHYRDQFEPWLRGAYHVLHLSRDDVEDDVESRTVIRPDARRPG